MEVEQGPLQALLLLAPWDRDLLHGQRVYPGIVHAGGDCSRGGIEVLHLVWDKALLMEILRQFYGSLQVAARVGGYEVWYQILLLAYPLIFFLEHGFEPLVDLGPWFAHQVQNPGAYVLWGNLELTADVMLTQLLEEGWILVCHQVVEPDARLYEYFLDSREGPEFAQQIKIVGVGDLQVGAGPREKAAAVLACPRCQLLFTCRLPEVGGRAAHIVDIAFEIWLLGEPDGLVYDGLMAPRLDDPPLVEGEGAEVAASETAPGADEAEFHLFYGRYSPLGLVDRMDSSHVWQGIYLVHLFHSKDMGRRVLNHILCPGLLHHHLAGEGVGIPVLDGKTAGKVQFVGLHLLVGGQGDELSFRQLRAFDHSSTDVLQIFYGNALFKGFGDVP